MKENKKRLIQIISILEKSYNFPKTSLLYKDPWQLIVATILSAQCTDKQVNKITPTLFNKYPTPRELGYAKIEEVENIIHSTGFFRNKAISIVESSKYIYKKWNNEIKETIAELTNLKGVGRKTANVVLFNAFDITEGIAVDTHVKRISKLLKLTINNDPLIIEKDLMKITPKKYWGYLSNFFINHGRTICIANRPKCNNCIIKELCPSKK